jgi:hypothetical protein
MEFGEVGRETMEKSESMSGRLKACSYSLVEPPGELCPIYSTSILTERVTISLWQGHLKSIWNVWELWNVCVTAAQVHAVLLLTIDHVECRALSLAVMKQRSGE